MKPVLLYFSMLCLAGKVNAQYVKLSHKNPFSEESKLPYHAPDFAAINNSHYQSALRLGIQFKLGEIGQIANNEAPASFENTLVALEKSGRLLDRTSRVFNMVSGANGNDTLQKIQEEFASQFAAVEDAIFLNTQLFKRVKIIYQKRKQLKLDAESIRLVEYYYERFIQSGALLSEADKDKVKQLNEEEATLKAKFNNMLLAAGKNAALVIDDASLLKGLSEGEIKAAKNAAQARGLNNQWLLTITNTTMQPAMTNLENRATRQQLFEASWNRAEKSDSNDTRSLVKRLIVIRAEKAKLMGQPNYAAWSMQLSMAKKPEKVSQLYNRIFPLAIAKAKEDAAAIQQLIDKQHGGFKLAAWDWDFYAEQIRKEKYDLDESETKPYFELNNVLENGVFYAANLMYGLTFKERKDIPVYHPDVKVYEVFDNGKPLALFYADYFKRDNKRGGAWMSNAVGQSFLMGTQPVIYNICNFPKPAAGQPALMSFSNVTTMFHEFGHALHGLFANQKYPSISGAATARDFVEFPSQFNEHWALDTKVLTHYAKHYQTGMPIPEALVAKIKNAALFNSGYAQAHAWASSSLDLQWHSLSVDQAKAVTDVDDFEKKAFTKMGINTDQVPPRYRSSYFQHVWGSGYAAAYYAYTWTKMLEEDAYTWVKEHGGLSRENGDRYRKYILSKGNTEDYTTMFKNFTGHEPSVEPMMKELGLK